MPRSHEHVCCSCVLPLPRSVNTTKCQLREAEREGEGGRGTLILRANKARSIAPCEQLHIPSMSAFVSEKFNLLKTFSILKKKNK